MVQDSYDQALPFWGFKICSKGSVGITTSATPSNSHSPTNFTDTNQQPQQQQPAPTTTTTTTTSTPNHENYSNFTDCLAQCEYIFFSFRLLMRSL